MTHILALPDLPPETRGPHGRDQRVDVIRGFCLLAIFFDHIPYDGLSSITLQSFGFSDAAEMFVFLAGFSAVTAYGRVVERQGWGEGMWRIGLRCIRLWGAHVTLLLSSVAILWLHLRLAGGASAVVIPLLDEGWGGLLRGMNLAALPAFLDILPLYIVLMLLFPALLMGLRVSTAMTLVVSGGVYVAANLLHYNIPNRIDPHGAAFWSFNPFTWQVMYVLGAVFAMWQRGGAAIAKPHGAVLALCWAYLLFAFVINDGWGVWPNLMRDGHVFRLFGNDPKSFLTTWRLSHALALATVLFTSHRFTRFCQNGALRLVAACGRHSLPVFWAGCLLSLLGRIAFHDLGHGVGVQVAVNVVGLTTMLRLAESLDKRRDARRLYGAPVPAVAHQGEPACVLP